MNRPRAGVTPLLVTPGVDEYTFDASTEEPGRHGRRSPHEVTSLDLELSHKRFQEPYSPPTVSGTP